MNGLTLSESLNLYNKDSNFTGSASFQLHLVTCSSHEKYPFSADNLAISLPIKGTLLSAIRRNYFPEEVEAAACPRDI